MTTNVTILPGGLRVATCEMPHAETVSVGLWAGVGGRHEPARLNGISHFIEHMLFKGTRRRSARRIMEEIEGVGGDINAYTSEERTCYYGLVAAEFFPRLCGVLCDMYTDPRFAPLDIERERGVIGEEILLYRDEPASHVQEILNMHFWRSHPLGRPLTGTMASIESFDRQDFLSYRQSHYHMGSTVLTAAGRVRHSEVVARASRSLAGLPRGRKPGTGRTPQPASGGVVAETRETGQTQLAIGFAAPGLLSPDRYAFSMLNTILGGNGSSRLFQRLRERGGLCYSVNSHPNLFTDAGMLNISAGLDARNLRKAASLILDEIRKLQQNPPSASELRRAKEYAIGTSRMSLERTATQSARLGTSLLIYNKLIDPEEVHDRIREVKADEVTAMAQTLNPANATVAIIGPRPQSPHIAEIFGMDHSG
jgi:predicted Zn-dependent peptidase